MRNDWGGSPPMIGNLITLFAWLVSQSASSVFPSHQISVSHQPPANQRYLSLIINQHKTQPSEQAVLTRAWCTQVRIAYKFAWKVSVFLLLELDRTSVSVFLTAAH